MSNYNKLPPLKDIVSRGYISHRLIEKIYEANATLLAKHNIGTMNFHEVDFVLSTFMKTSDPKCSFIMRPREHTSEQFTAVFNSPITFTYTAPITFNQLWQQHVTESGDKWVSEIHKDLFYSLENRLIKGGWTAYLKRPDGTMYPFAIPPARTDIGPGSPPPKGPLDILLERVNTPDENYTSEFASIWIGPRYPREAFEGTWPENLVLKETTEITDTSRALHYGSFLLPFDHQDDKPVLFGPIKIYHNLPKLSSDEVSQAENESDMPPEDDGRPHGPGIGPEDGGPGPGYEGPGPGYEGEGPGPGYGGDGLPDAEMPDDGYEHEFV